MRVCESMASVRQLSLACCMRVNSVLQSVDLYQECSTPILLVYGGIGPKGPLRQGGCVVAGMLHRLLNPCTTSASPSEALQYHAEPLSEGHLFE